MSLEIVYELSGIHEATAFVWQNAQDHRIWLLEGEMGAGKTTFVKALGSYLKWGDTPTSPTFSLVNEYRSGGNESIYHFDFYRINDEVEALDIGADEYFESGELCLIEWSAKIPSLIPPRYLQICINLELDTSRRITLTHHD